MVQEGIRCCPILPVFPVNPNGLNALEANCDLDGHEFPPVYVLGENLRKIFTNPNLGGYLEREVERRDDSTSYV